MWTEVEAKTFFSLLWSAYAKTDEIGYIELRYSNAQGFDGKNIEHIWGTTDDIPGWVENIDYLKKLPHNVHYGVLPRLKMSGKGDCIKGIGCAWVDIDGIDLGVLRGHVLPTLDRLGLRPSMYVDSGWGFHLFWVFSELTYLSDLVKNSNTVLSLITGGDSSVSSLSHLLRCPSSWNCKALPPRRVVAYVWSGEGFAYDPSLFLSLTGRMWDKYSSNFDKKPTASNGFKNKDNDLEAIAKSCLLIDTALNAPGDLSYVGWISLCAFLCQVYSDGESLFHEISSRDKVRYDFMESNNIIKSMKGYLPYNSEKIPECMCCKHKCKNIITLGGKKIEKNSREYIPSIGFGDEGTAKG